MNLEGNILVLHAASSAGPYMQSMLIEWKMNVGYQGLALLGGEEEYFQSGIRLKVY